MEAEIVNSYMMYNTFVVVAGIIGVSYATAKTKDPNCLWALLLLGFLLMTPKF